MPLKLEIGTAGGQEYPVLRSIQSFLGQMAEKGARLAPLVLKELLQNADDAGATEVAVILDERTPRAGLAKEYEVLCEPALLVCNNSHFRLDRDSGVEKIHDDFKAICDVAGGHKRAMATAAGRFGIGFNSVYFLTDTPLIFSRKEIHVFDLLHRIFEVNGWRFPLEDYRRYSGSSAGSFKEVLGWCFPSQALVDGSIDNLVEEQKDYQRTVFRLPLRKSSEGMPALFEDRFLSSEHRHRLLREMAEEAVRSILFLKNVSKISFSTLRDTRAPTEKFATVSSTTCPETFKSFLQKVTGLAAQVEVGAKLTCRFDRTITRHDFTGNGTTAVSEKSFNFHLRHTACFDDDGLHELRARLIRNGERATPWVALAVPLDRAACCLDGSECANWRVFLPLLEEGPCSCLLSGAFFVGLSRQRVEFRLDESDEGKRKTNWNQLLVQKALIPLLQDVSVDLPNLASGLLEQHPKEYLGLFPMVSKPVGEPASLTDFARRCFSASVWVLYLRDLWNAELNLIVGDANGSTVVDLIPPWLAPYRDCFCTLSTEKRRFVRHDLGNALSDRVARNAGVTIRKPVAKDIALLVLRSAQPPKEQDLQKLLQLILEPQTVANDLEGLWAFCKPQAEEFFRYEVAELYLLEQADSDAVITHLRKLKLPFENLEWVRHDVGLPPLLSEFHPPLDNILGPSQAAALEILRHLSPKNQHDQVLHDYEITPVVDFLIGQPAARITPDLKLGFMVRTATNQADRRTLGVMLLKPMQPTLEDEAVWDVWFRPIFAHVDPSFAKELERLLAVHPGTVAMMQAADCQVAVANAKDGLAIFHAARLKQSNVCSRMEVAIADASRKNQKIAERAAAFLLETADELWDSFDEAQRYSVLVLPIHRCSDGRFISLLPVNGGDMSDLPKKFRLQSEDDIQDAPIDVAKYQLLQTSNSTVKRFYRRRLGLEEHGRVAVLKGTLSQIGGAQRDSQRMLRYLVQYYYLTLSELKQSTDASNIADALELETLMASARTVPCIDETWCMSQNSAEAWQIADYLANQGWPVNDLRKLLLQLFCGSGKSIASLNTVDRELLPRLHRLNSWSTRKIVELAITSESPDFSSSDRMKLFWENRTDLPDAGVTRSQAAGILPVPTWSGEATLAESEFFPVMPDLPTATLALLAPHAIDLRSLAKKVGLRLQDLPKTLTAFRNSERTGSDMDDRLVQNFSEVWPKLDNKDRMHVLRYVGKRNLQERLTEQAKRLDAILVATRLPAWKEPEKVISPNWVETKPPHVPLENQAASKGIDGEVSNVWDAWCGMRTFGAVFSQVMAGAAQDGAERRNAAAAVYTWLDWVLQQTPSEEELQILNGRSWVLAQRDGVLDFKPPAGVLLHAGEKVLGARFWVRALPLPDFCRRRNANLNFLTTLAATPANLEDIGECLVERARFDENAAVSVYALVESMLEEAVTLRKSWQNLAARLPVYRTFRDQERQVTSVQLFIGNDEYNEDLSTGLLRLKALSDPPTGILGRYRSLGVQDCPTIIQVLAALGGLTSDDPKASSSSYGRLIRTFLKLTNDAELPLDLKTLGAIRILTCASTYQPISDCYWDEDLGRQERVVPEHTSLLIDSTDKTTVALVAWLREHHAEVLIHLRTAGNFEPADDPQPMTEPPEVSYLLSPWRQWFQHAAREGSSLRDELARLTLNFPSETVTVVPVRTIRVRCRLHNGGVIEQSKNWSGPLAFAPKPERLYVRIEEANSEIRKIHDRIRSLDLAVAREIAFLLGVGAVSARLPSLVEEITATLERPSTVLKRLCENYRDNFLHQYHDQVADPAFAELFEEYQRTSQTTKRGQERRAELDTQMFALLEIGFVRARRDQIKGYGYDEFSVFAELLQNAEDAYSQMQ